MVYSDNKLYEPLINEFKELVEKAQAEHKKKQPLQRWKKHYRTWKQMMNMPTP